MAIPFECTGCGKKLKVKDESAGKRIKCPECQAVLTVPKPESVDAEDDFLGGLDEAVKQERKRPRAAIEEDDDDVEDYGDDPPASAPKRRTKKTSAKRSSSSGSGGGVLKIIGSVFVGLLVCLGIIGKVARVARVGGAFNQSVSWQNFRHPNGGASIDMPGVATLNIKASSDPNAQVYTSSTRNFACSLTATTLPPLAQMGLSTNPAMMDQVFEEMKKGMLGMKPGASLISETRIQHGATRGLEMRIEFDGLVNISRSFVTNTHLIASEIVFKKGTEPATERDRFFNSIQLAGTPMGGVAAMPGAAMPNTMPPGAAASPTIGTPAVP